MNDEIVVTDDLELLLDALPPRVRLALRREGLVNLLEIVLDLGRMPEARYPGSATDLGGELVSARTWSMSSGASGNSATITGRASSARCTASPPSATAAARSSASPAASGAPCTAPSR